MEQDFLVRVDDRLFYSQISNDWMRTHPNGGVLIVDDETARKPYMKKIIELLQPALVRMEIRTCHETGTILSGYDPMGAPPLLVLFRSLTGALRTYMDGFHFTALEVGDTGATEGARILDSRITISSADYKHLEFLHDKGVMITLKRFIEDKQIPWFQVRQTINI